MAEKLRCAVIGTGGIGLEHLSSLLQCPRAVAVAIADQSPNRVKEAAERFKIPRSYTDYHDLLDQPDVEAVTVAVPNNLHAAVAVDALHARKHVLLEKPMAVNAKEAARMVEAAKKSKRLLMVGQNFRFHRQTQHARMLIERGELGELYHARGFWLRRSHIPRIGSWFTQKQFAGGGCVCDLGVHVLDLCLHLLGDFDVRCVLAQTYGKFGPRGLGEFEWGKSEVDPKKPFNVEDTGVALLKLRSGKSVSLEVSWAGHHAPDQRELGVDLLGTEAGLSLFPARLYRPGVNGLETVHLATPAVPHSEDRIHHFVTCVLQGRKPLVPIEESLKVQQILDAIYASAASCKEVRIG
ncbi:MAG: Gfo/Idh/MocA family oxidoreductase [Verrucomicrobia bacterium]|nr:Gfo/Idh/MocA family oxidoreductase [Verrucomicrobiota bacterium]